MIIPTVKISNLAQLGLAQTKNKSICSLLVGLHGINQHAYSVQSKVNEDRWLVSIGLVSLETQPNQQMNVHLQFHMYKLTVTTSTSVVDIH
jgi:hypothetical protein